MHRSLVRRLRQEEDGFALILALALIVVFSITTVTAITYTTVNQSSASRSSADLTALQNAEAGINDAVSVIGHASSSSATATSPTLLGCSVSAQNPSNSATPCLPLAFTMVTGSVAVYGLYTQGAGVSGTWAIVSTGSAPNPNNVGTTVGRTLRASLAITPGGSINNLSVYNYIYSTAPQGSGCEVDLSGDKTIVDVPIYVTGDLCLSGDHATITQDRSAGGQTVDLEVGGTLTISGAHATVGASGTPIASGYVALGCNQVYGTAAHACTPTDRYYVSSSESAGTPSPPTMDFISWYANASPGPMHTCDSNLTPSPNLMTAQPHAFDNDATMNGTNSLFLMTPLASDYNCVTSTGTLSWNHTSHLLTINGTIFLDGNVELDDGHALYHGKATIYVNGEVFFNNGHGSAAGLHAGCPASPATPTGQCAFNAQGSNGWDPNKDMIVFAVNKSSGTAIDLTADKSEFQGDLLCTPTSTAALAGDHTAVEGGIICGKFTWGDHTQLYPLPTIAVKNLPNGIPNWPATISPPVLTGS